MRISKTELEAFISEVVDFTKRHELVLSELDLASSKLEGLGETIRQQISRGGEVISQIRRAIERLCERTEDVLGELSTERA